MYADDTVLLSKGNTLEEAIITNQALFNQYIDWATIATVCIKTVQSYSVNCFNINVTKTKSMAICSKYKNVLPSVGNPIMKSGHPIVSVNTYPYLGVDIDCNVTFESFIKSTIIFSKIRYVLTFAAAVLVYKQMVLPFFDYLDILVDSGPKKYIDTLQALQFRGIKIIYLYYIEGRRIKNNDEEYLHRELNLSYLNIRRRRHILHMMYNLLERNLALLDTRDNGIVLRSSNSINFINFIEQKLLEDVIFGSSYHLWCRKQTLKLSSIEC